MIYDLAILGGGPAGVAAGVYAARKKLKTVFITKNWESQSTVSEGIENWIGTIKIPGLQFAKNLEAHLRAYADGSVEIKTGEGVSKIEKTEAGFKITTNKESYETKTILIATGSARTKLQVKGADIFEHKGLTYCASCDGPLFADQDVLVVGGGNAGFESAAQLLAYCKSVTLINRSDKFRADPVTIETVSKNPHFKIITHALSKEVRGDKFVTGFVYTDVTTHKDVELPVTGIFVEIGSTPTTYFVKDLVEMDQWQHIIVDPRTQMTSVPGIWAAGDCTDGLYHQNNIAAGDAVKALEDIYLFLKTK
jgi:alkyl hydroperoxide reductase subunit F